MAARYPLRRARPVLARTLPAVLAIAAILDVMLRMIPADRFSFRAWEAAWYLPSREGPFRARFHYENECAHGDLPNLGGMPWLQECHRDVFTTDGNGFRNPSGVGERRPPSVMLFGDSFAAGASLADSDTLSERLMAKTGASVFNAGAFTGDFEAKLELVDEYHLQGGLVIYQHLGRSPIPGRPRSTALGFAREVRRRLDTCAPLELLGSVLAWTPAQILSQRLYRKVHAVLGFPNPGEDVVSVAALPNGKVLGFLSAQVTELQGESAAGLDVGFFAELRAALAARNDRLLVLLVPEKYAVYQPMLEDAAKWPVPPSVEYLAHVGRSLAEAGVDAIDLTPALREKAQEAARSGRLLYWADDTHWNRDGVDAAVEEIAKGRYVLPGGTANLTVVP